LMIQTSLPRQSRWPKINMKKFNSNQCKVGCFQIPKINDSRKEIRVGDGAGLAELHLRWSGHFYLTSKVNLSTK
jgi:hypothetical protein